VELHVAVAAAHRLSGDLAHERVVGVAHEAGVGRHLRPRRAAQQPVERQAGGLTRDVPEGDVEPRDGVDHRPVPAEIVGFLLQVVVEAGDVGGVAADGERADEAVEDHLGGLVDVVTERLAPPGEPLIRVHADQQGVQRAPHLAAEARGRAAVVVGDLHDRGFDASDLHVEALPVS
jgi:hypothetical protein